MRRLLPITLLVLVSSSTVLAKDWRGILPLHSTREHVEALFGPPPPPPEGRAYELNKGRSIYYLEEGEVYIVFATEDFLKQNNCQAVAPGTVLMIRVKPNEMLLSSLQLDEKTLKKFDASNIAELKLEGFVDEKDGLVVRANKGKVEEIVYLASAVDRGRCPDYYAQPEGFVRIYVCGLLAKFDGYGKIRFSDEKARLDNFAIQLQNEETSQGYIIVYAGRKATFAEAQKHVNRARDYLIRVRGLDPETVKAIDGGFREDFMVELYIIPAGAAPPVATPTVDPSQAELIYEQPRRSKRKRP